MLCLMLWDVALLPGAGRWLRAGLGSRKPHNTHTKIESKR